MRAFHLLRSLRTLARKVSLIDVYAFEDGTLYDIEIRLRPPLERFMGEGLDIIRELIALYETGPDPEETGSGAESSGDAQPSGPSSAASPARSRQTVADVCFMAHLDLSHRLKGLRMMDEDQSGFHILQQLDRCRRGLLKACVAVEDEVCQLEGQKPSLAFVAEIHVARKARAAYARFYRAVHDLREPTRETLDERLREAAGALALLVGDEIYPRLRPGDRRAIKQLRRRLVDAVEAEGESSDTGSGWQVWKDVRAFAGVLRQVNNRAELVGHDRATIVWAERYLVENGALVEKVPLRVLEELELLRGRDAELDRLLVSEEEVAAAQLLAVLTRVRHQLDDGRAAAAVASTAMADGG